MKLPVTNNLSTIASLLKRSYIGSADHAITGINEIHMVEHGDLTFVDHPKYYTKALQSNATTIIIDQEVECPPGKALIISPVPFDDYNLLTRHFSPFIPQSTNISPSAIIGENTILQPGVIVGNNVKIGSNCIIYPNVVIYDGCTIGNNVIIHANTVIGGDAFYYKKKEEGYIKMHSCGTVIIEDFVEIGCACTIDRGVSGATKIAKGTKIDNQVHIGHDTIVGEHCLMAAQVGIAGVTTLEDEVILWGQVGVNKDLTIGKKAIVYAQSGVAKSIEGGKSYFGSPVLEAREKMKELAMVKNLKYLFKKE